ncbi:MAG: hypothetical protein R3C40_06185 [Parvularculaceae bacterium]
MAKLMSADLSSPISSEPASMAFGRLATVFFGPMLAHKAEDDGAACIELTAGKAGHVNGESCAQRCLYFRLKSLALARQKNSSRKRALNIR